MSWCLCLAATWWMPSGQTAHRRQWCVAVAPAVIAPYRQCIGNAGLAIDVPDYDVANRQRRGCTQHSWRASACRRS